MRGDAATVLHAIDAQARTTPGAIAIDSAAETVTYAELAARVDAIGARLIEAGVEPGDIVALIGRRSVDTVAALLAIMRAGGVYLPIAPTSPAERCRFMLEDSGARLVVLTAGGEALPAEVVARALVVRGRELPPPPRPGAIVPGSAALAYVIYTSGTTGRPKGALIEHAGLVNRIEWMREAYGVGVGDAILVKTPFSFDVSIWELLLPFVAGARMVLLPDEAEHFPPAIIETIRRFGVTLCHFIPSLLGAFLGYLDDDQDIAGLQTLRRVFCSGEALTATHARQFADKLHARHGTRLTNFYGPTEATIDVTYYDCPVTDVPHRIPIGRPLPNTTIRIIDGGREVPAGTAGELCIGGVQVARGYLNRPALTAERFVTIGGERLYRTGDLARLLPDGNIEYLGRMDTQIKIRGMRIELEEIEHAVIEGGGAIDCVVVLDRRSELVENLVAFVTARSAFDHHATLTTLKARLPDYMIPRRFVVLEELPRLGSGKIDRGTLTAMAAEGASAKRPVP